MAGTGLNVAPPVGSAWVVNEPLALFQHSEMASPLIHHLATGEVVQVLELTKNTQGHRRLRVQVDNDASDGWVSAHDDSGDGRELLRPLAAHLDRVLPGMVCMVEGDHAKIRAEFERGAAARLTRAAACASSAVCRSAALHLHSRPQCIR